jgi:hypothetical protein
MEAYLLNYREIYDLIMNTKYSRHAEQRLVERLKIHNKYHIHGVLMSKVLNARFAYMNTDGCINVAVDEESYLVVVPRDDDYLCITYKEPSHNGYTVYDKWDLAKKGVER